MAERYTRHMNDRREGRQLYTLPAYARIQPYILRRRSDAACFLSDSVEVTGVEKWLREKRAGVIVTRDLAISSPTLGASGACDVVEFRKSADGIPLPGEEGRFRPYPVEYKHGSPREDLANELQLCGQAMCLEEMLCCDIQKGALYFGEMRHRIEVEFTPELRREVVDTMKEMHSLYRRGHTPKVKPTKSCNACSLKDLCLPRMSRCGSVKSYLQRHMEEIP